MPGWYMVEVESKVLEKSCNAIISIPADDNTQPVEKVIHLIDGETTKRIIYLERSVREIKIKTIESEVLISIKKVKFAPLPEKRVRQLMLKKIKRGHQELASGPGNQLQMKQNEDDLGKLIKKYDACFALANPAHLQAYWHKRLHELWWQTDEIQLS